jgi:hypothetical protein
MGGAHPGFDRAEWVFDDFAPELHQALRGQGHLPLHGVDNALMLSTSDTAHWAR